MSSNYRPLYHFSPQRGWINDPNGLVYHDGLWHLFYQHIPTQTHWGPMHWGHAVSRDLTNWEHWPIALFPDELGAIFSGSAAVAHRDGQQEIVACFTHSSERLQEQSLAFSKDGGRTFDKYENNPVLTIGRTDFRDPKIFLYQDQWIMIVSAGFEAQIYSSADLIDWTLLSSFAAPKEGWVWECPDLFELDGRWVLLASFYRPIATGGGDHATYYWLGSFDGVQFTAETEKLSMAFGPDDYAAVSWNDAPDNRRVMLGWMSKWSYAAHTPTGEDDWRGAMTLPRDVTLAGDKLLQAPSPEVLARRGAPIAFDENGIDYSGESYEIEVEIDLSELKDTQAGFRLRVGDGEATQVFYDTTQREIVMDRTQSGQIDFHATFPGRFHETLEVKDNLLKLRIFVDRCSVEVFAQDGELYGPMLVFPASGSQSIEFFGDGARIVKGTIYSYESE